MFDVLDWSLFSKHPVLFGEQNKREEIRSVFNFKEFINRLLETNSLESPFNPDCPSRHKTSYYINYSVL